MIFNYYIKTTIGEGWGSIDANSEEEARSLLASQHQGPYEDEDEQIQQNEVITIDLTLA